MTVRVAFDEDECQLIARLACADISSVEEVEKTFIDLNIALSKIDENLGNSDICFFLVELKAKGVRPGYGAFDPYEGANSLGAGNPWKVFCPPFWTKACSLPHLRQRAKDYMRRVEHTLKLAATHSRSTDSLWEDDETQFGQPLATHLALLDIEFVPDLVRLLPMWDPGHDVHIQGAISEIVEKHGVRAETEALLTTFTEWSGSDELITS
ncbi:hypothetical protein SSBR45G_42480 [Bradyrhizobium sp. SSBR45G]|uniref:hypothetical protein n=1 Tax=unclassified Bradyrhizobium TaxID=2631580 RepID=UPI002342A074|nr:MULTISPECIES: hypothetical protein [unclassified Bradyrhizobium]GLH79339.1 hypothetical protein SSBR45G_42480 [Bradyrhizobium sp. SSBR45G]GLH86725.1 hypothetical protein SSBR45R_41850 [Bradyrhizobium sp. SSBR45R]